jgi:hypothetical protein
MKTSSRRANPGHLPVTRWCLFCCLFLTEFVINMCNKIRCNKHWYIIYFTVVALCVKLDHNTHKEMHSVLTTGCDSGDLHVDRS